MAMSDSGTVAGIGVVGEVPRLARINPSTDAFLDPIAHPGVLPLLQFKHHRPTLRTKKENAVSKQLYKLSSIPKRIPKLFEYGLQRS